MTMAWCVHPDRIMATPTTITFRTMDPSPFVEASIQRWVDRLATAFPRIERCDVVIDRPHRHGRHGNLFHVRIDLVTPHKVIAVSADPGQDHSHEDVYVAIGDAFRAARRQLHDHAEIQRGDVKAHA